jgi:hypothetical protein
MRTITIVPASPWEGGVLDLRPEPRLQPAEKDTPIDAEAPFSLGPLVLGSSVGLAAALKVRLPGPGYVGSEWSGALCPGDNFSRVVLSPVPFPLGEASPSDSKHDRCGAAVQA